jgi:hypothetical protein
MLNDEELDAALRDADPIRSEAEALPDPDGPAALRIRTQARRRSRRSRTRRLVAIPASMALAIGGATAGAVALVGGGDGHVSDPTAMECVHPSAPKSTIAGDNVATDDPLDLCRQAWRLGGDPVPDRLVACAPADGQGRITVYAGGPAVCEENGQVVYVGPTGEQGQLDLVQDQLPERIDDSDCVTPQEAVAVAEELMAEHHLTGWTATVAGPGYIPQGMQSSLGKDGCAVWLEYAEEDREIVFAPHHGDD